MMAARRRGARRKNGYGSIRSGQAWPASRWLMMLGALAAVAALVSAFVYQRQVEVTHAIDETTLCPADTGPRAMTAILIDVTDPLSIAQAGMLKQYVRRRIDEAPAGTQFTLGVVSEDPARWGASEALCKPLSGEDVSQLNQNVRAVQRRYEERFLEPVSETFDRLITASGANQSPIMESLQALVADTPDFVIFDGPKALIVVSDLLQHSDVMSFYRGHDWQSFVNSSQAQRLSQSLTGAEVGLFLIPRPAEGIRDPAAVEDFWIRYLDLQGANAPDVRRLGDL